VFTWHPPVKSTIVGKHIVLRIVRNYELLYHCFSSTSLQNTASKIREKKKCKWKKLK